MTQIGSQPVIRTSAHIGLSLTSGALQSIQEAVASEAFDIRLLTKERDGLPWLLVLAGEHHYKSEADSKMGLSLISHFNLRGLEEYDDSKTWGGSGLHYIFSELPETYWYQHLKGLKGSTIHRFLLDPSEAAVPNRDATMARNIMGAYRERQNYNTMLAIVGADHVPGISARLTGEHGFQEVDIPR